MHLQIFISLFVIFILLEIFRKFHQKILSLFSLIFWLTIWLSILSIVWFPSITSYLAQFLNIGRAIDSVVYLSIVILFYLIYRILLKIEIIERKMEKIVREDALHARKR